MRARVLKKLDEPFSFKVGERLLAGMTFNEGTQIVESVRAISDSVFGENAEPGVARNLIIITDGLSSMDGGLATGIKKARSRCPLPPISPPRS